MALLFKTRAVSGSSDWSQSLKSDPTHNLLRWVGKRARERGRERATQLPVSGDWKIKIAKMKNKQLGRSSIVGATLCLFLLPGQRRIF